ncbi:MAG: SAM-dependent methyltransferase [Streptosporangiaceae bacterium]
MLNFIPATAQVQAIVSQLTAAVAPGSYLAITHPTLELGGEENARAMRFWNENATPPITARTGAEIAGFFAGLRLLDPRAGAVLAVAAGPARARRAGGGAPVRGGGTEGLTAAAPRTLTGPPAWPPHRPAPALRRSGRPGRPARAGCRLRTRPARAW